MENNLTILLLLVLLNSQIFAQQNILKNPGFEEGVTNGWWLNAWGGAEANLSDTADAYNGNKAALIKVTTPDAQNIAKVSLMSDSMNTVPQGELLLSVWAKSLTEFLPFKLSLRCTDSAGNNKYYNSEEFYLRSNFQLFTYKITPDPSYLQNAVVRLMCGKTIGTYLFDDVVLKENIIGPPPVPSGRRLRKIVNSLSLNKNVYIGGTILSSLFNTPAEEILNREFSYITPANDFKESYIHPEPGVWKWNYPDQWVSKAKANNQVIRMHSPISPQCSKWAKDDSRKPEELLQNLQEYMTELCKRYNNYDNILWMDVVNETIDANTGEWFGPKPGTDSWENPWTIIGFDSTDVIKPPLYIKYAFEIANQYAPHIKQIINQHGSMVPATWKKLKQLVFYLRGKGLRVDGIGFQAHVDVGWELEEGNLDRLSELIDWAHANNLEFHITENNVFLKGANKGKWNEQATTYKAIVQLLLSKRKTGVVTWNTWQLRDSDGQASDRTPSIFFEDGSAKPAYYAIQSVLENIATDINQNEFIPEQFYLGQNYPNPFNPATTINFSIDKQSHVNLKVYDLLGKEVAALINKEMGAGTYSVSWNAKDSNGNLVPSGVYFYTIASNGRHLTKKMTFLK